jgi:protein TonB
MIKKAVVSTADRSIFPTSGAEGKNCGTEYFMTSKIITTSMEVDGKPERRDVAERRFYGVVIASLLLHIVGFAILLSYEQRRAVDPPRVIMVDMTTVVPPEPKAVAVATPKPVQPPPRIQSPVVTAAPPTSHPVVSPVVNAPPVPVAAIGDSPKTSVAPARSEMTVPLAPPVARKPAESAPSATTVAHGPSTPADGAEKLAKARTSYRAMIAALIDKNKEYPLFSRRTGQQGTCSVRCTMMCDGTIKRVELAKSSGYEALDKAGLRAVNNVGKFPPPPQDGGCTEVSFEVPITFRLS